MRGGEVFDSVVLVAPAPARRLSSREFFELPLSVRIQHVIERTARFYAADREIDRVQALAEIRRLQARS